MFAKTVRVAMLCAITACIPVSAAIVQTLQPDAAYTSSTTLIPITDPAGTEITQLSDGNLTVTFSHALAIALIGNGWATWGSPPDTETATPPMLHHPDYDPSATSLTLTFSTGITTFGLEAEPDPFDFRNTTMDFYNDLVLLGSITRSIHGNAGARLLAGTSTDAPITRVVISSDVDFGIAQLRYDESAVPEPSSLALIGGGLGALAFFARRRRQ